MSDHVLTEQLLGMLNYCEAHKFRQVAYKSGVSQGKAYKISSKNVAHIKNASVGSAFPSLALYDFSCDIAFETGVLKQSEVDLVVFKRINTDRPMPFHNFLGGLIYTFFTDQGFEVKELYFVDADTGENILESWGKNDFNYEFFKREQQASSFWAKGLISKKIRPSVTAERCRACKMKSQCKNYMKYTEMPKEVIFEEFVP